MTIGSQIAEAVRLHRDVSREAATDRAVEVLDLVGIAAARPRGSTTTRTSSPAACGSG